MKLTAVGAWVLSLASSIFVQVIGVALLTTIYTKHSPFLGWMWLFVLYIGIAVNIIMLTLVIIFEDADITAPEWVRTYVPPSLVIAVSLLWPLYAVALFMKWFMEVGIEHEQ